MDNEIVLTNTALIQASPWIKIYLQNESLLLTESP